MLKKMMLMALALVAFAAPAPAQADVLLTDRHGSPVAEGSEITATSTNLKTTLNPPNAVPALECAKVTLHMTVETNGPNQVVIVPHPETSLSTAATEGCVLNVNGVTKLPVTITDGTVGTLTIDRWGTGNMAVTFRHDIAPLGLLCALAGNVHLLATDQTDLLDVGPSVLTKDPFAGISPGCSAVGTIEGEFTLENSLGALIVDAENTGIGVSMSSNSRMDSLTNTMPFPYSPRRGSAGPGRQGQRIRQGPSSSRHRRV